MAGWRADSGCSLERLFGHRLGYFWISGFGLQSYAAWEPDLQAGEYFRECLQHLGGRFWHAEALISEEAAGQWAAAPGETGSFSPGRRSMAFCAPANCSVRAVLDRVAPLHLLIEVLSLRSRMSSVDLLRAFAAKIGASPDASRWLRDDLRRMRRSVAISAREVAASQERSPCPWRRVLREAAFLEAGESAALDAAARDFQRCVDGLGARLWATTVQDAANTSSVLASGRGAIAADLMWSASWAVCAPRGCSEGAVRSVIVPAVWAARSCGRPTPGSSAEGCVKPARLAATAAPLLHAVGLRVQELAAWSELDLSWAILGLAGCGTSSFAAALHSHPELELLHTDSLLEDSSFFLSPMTHPFALPTRLEVSRFNRWGTKARSTSRSARRLRGVKRPQYIRSDLALARLGQVPGLRALAVLDDPALRAEREYLKNAARCRQQNASFLPPALGACLGRVCMPRCPRPRSGQRSGFDLREGDFLAAQRVRRALAELGSEAEERFFLAERRSLAEDPLAFYNRAADFLGVGAFPEATVFAAVNEANLAPASTADLRGELFALRGPGSPARHEMGLALLRGFFAGERWELRELFRRLPPRLPPAAWPAWLREEQEPEPALRGPGEWSREREG